MLDDINGPPPGTAAASDAQATRLRLPLAQLPAMPEVLARLFEACQKEDVGNEELAGIAALDPALAAKLLAAAAPLEAGDAEAPLGLVQCAASIGVAAIRGIALAEAAVRAFEAPATPQQAARKRAWKRALKGALLARSVAAAMAYPDLEEAYLAGLLREVGGLALLSLDATYARWLESADDEALCRLECERYGLTGAQAGAWLTEQWQPASFLSDALLYQDEPVVRLGGAHPLMRIVSLVHRLMRATGAQDVSELARLYGVPAQAIASAMEAAEAEAARIAADLGIAEEGPAPPVAIGAPPVAVGMALAQGKPAAGLASLLEQKLLGDSMQAWLRGGETADALLRAMAQVLQAMFGLRAMVFFLREDGGAAFTGKTLSRRHAKAARLRFDAAQSGAQAGRAVEGTPAIWFEDEEARAPLDSQLLRLLGSPGAICIPLGAGQRCAGLVVAALESREHGRHLLVQAPLLATFGTLAGPLLEGAMRAAGPVPAGLPTEVGASREQIRQLLHEVSNPLTIIGNYLATLRMGMGQGTAGEKELGIVAEEIGRVTQILDHFQNTPRAAPGSADAANLRALLQGLLDLAAGSGLVPAEVKVETDLEAAGAAQVAQPDKLKQVLLNLMKNAFEAMPAGGRLWVSVSLWRGGAGSRAEITLEDTGPGLPEEVERHLFQPVGSTKGGRHFGIGLSIAAQLVKEMDGLIHCHSGRGGCRFRIILPVVTP